MTFTLSSSVLSNKLGILAKVINSKNSLSILDSFLFSVDGETLTVTASDNNNMMKCFIPLTNASGQGAFCVSNKLILNAIITATSYNTLFIFSFIKFWKINFSIRTFFFNLS